MKIWDFFRPIRHRAMPALAIDRQDLTSASADHGTEIDPEQVPELPTSIASEMPMTFSTRIVSADELMDFRRLDLFVKARLFESIKTGKNRSEAEELYRQHILLRTGGLEPLLHGDDERNRKVKVDDYVRAAENLYHSLSFNGFDPARFVPLGTDGLPQNGAHRIACAHILGIPVVVADMETPGIAWDFDWFQSVGFADEALRDLLYWFGKAHPKRTSIFILWAPVVNQWDQLVNLISQRFNLVGYQDIAFASDETAAFQSLIYDIYSFGIRDQIHSLAHIERKIELLKKFPGFIRVGMISSDSDMDFEAVSDLKRNLREFLAGVVPVESFITCHFADSIDETSHLLSTLLSNNNFNSVRQRRANKPRDEFLAWLNDLENVLEREQIDRRDICIVGSSALELVGIRNSTDIDITLRKSLREAKYGDGVTKLSNCVDIVTAQYHRTEAREAVLDDDLIDSGEHHTVFRGFKFANVRIVKERKYFSRRPKDLLDVALIERWENLNTF